MAINPNSYPILGFGIDEGPTEGLVLAQTTIDIGGGLFETFYLQELDIPGGGSLPTPISGTWGALDTKAYDYRVIGFDIIGFGIDDLDPKTMFINDPENAATMFIVVKTKLPNLEKDCGALQTACPNVLFGYGDLAVQWEGGPGVVGYLQVAFDCPVNFPVPPAPDPETTEGPATDEEEEP